MKFPMIEKIEDITGIAVSHTANKYFLVIENLQNNKSIVFEKQELDALADELKEFAKEMKE